VKANLSQLQLVLAEEEIQQQCVDFQIKWTDFS